MWQDSQPKSFPELQGEFHLHRSQFYKYLQLRYALLAQGHALLKLPESNPLENKAICDHMGRGGISRLYRTLVVNSPNLFQPLRARWESWVGSLNEEDWHEARMSPWTPAISSRLLLI